MVPSLAPNSHKNLKCHIQYSQCGSKNGNKFCICTFQNDVLSSFYNLRLGAYILDPRCGKRSKVIQGTKFSFVLKSWGYWFDTFVEETTEAKNILRLSRLVVQSFGKHPQFRQKAINLESGFCLFLGCSGSVSKSWCNWRGLCLYTRLFAAASVFKNDKVLP